MSNRTWRLTTSRTRKPAWALARRRACLRFGVGPSAFGQALGNSLAHGDFGSGTTQPESTQTTGDFTRMDGASYRGTSYEAARFQDALVGAFNSAGPGDMSNGELLADASGKTPWRQLGGHALDDFKYNPDGTPEFSVLPDVNIVGQRGGLTSQRSGQTFASQSAASDPAQSLERGLSNILDMANAYKSSGLSGATGDSLVFSELAQAQQNNPGQVATLLAADGMRIGPTIERALAMGIYSAGASDAAYQARIDANSPSLTAWDGVSRDAPAVAYLKQSLGGLDPVRGDQMQFRVAQSLPEAALNELGGLAIGKVLGSVLGWAEKVAPRAIYLDPNDALAIVNTAKGLRPLPDTYLPQSMIDAHAGLFEGGAARIQSWTPKASQTIGQNETWVMPKTFADRAISEAGGNVGKLEQLLGLEKGSLGSAPVRVDIPRPIDLRIPSGNEVGANPLWNPGGYTNGGIPEAVIKPIPPSS